MVQQADSQDVLSQLVETLRLEPGSAHVQHALVRVRRADNELANALNDGTEAEVDASWAIVARKANPQGTTDEDERRRKMPPQAAQLDVGPAATARLISALPAPSSSVRSQAFDLAYTSFLLATAPRRVLPPGKTLHEALHARSFPLPSPLPQLAIESADPPERRDQHELAAGRLTAFVKALAPSSSPVARTRGWNRLKAAVWDAAKALVIKERGDRVDGPRASLEAAFRPDPDETTFSVDGATALLHSLILTLAELCSSARDVQVNPIISTLSAPIIPSKVTPARPTRIPASNLSLTTLVEAVRDLIRLSRDMTSDLDLFKKTVSGAIDDELMVKIAAWENERTAINLVYPGPDSVQESVLRWLVRRGEASVRTTWLAPATKPANAEATRGSLIASALVETIFADSAVGVEKVVGMPTRTSRTNALPAILVVQSPTIFRLQNFVQALTIVACLASLAGVPAPRAPAPDPLGDEWASRLWALLRADLDTDAVSSRGAITLEQADSAPVVLADLADEILRVRRLSRGEALDNRFEVEDRVVRASVNRIIQSEDPVYKLLKARAKDAVLHALRRPPGLALGVPASMHTGIMGLPGKKTEKRKLVVPAVKGFSRQPLLGRKLAELAEQVAGIVAWSADVWGDQLAFVAV